MYRPVFMGSFYIRISEEWWLLIVLNISIKLLEKGREITLEKCKEYSKKLSTICQ